MLLGATARLGNNAKRSALSMLSITDLARAREGERLAPKDREMQSCTRDRDSAKTALNTVALPAGTSRPATMPATQQVNHSVERDPKVSINDVACGIFCGSHVLRGVLSFPL